MPEAKQVDVERRLLVRKLARELPPCAVDAAAYAVLVALDAAGAAGGVLALALGLHLVDVVAGTATTDVVDGGLLGAEALLLLELLVEGEHGTLGLLHVAGTTTANGVDGVGGRRCELDARGRARGSLSRSDLRSLDAHGIASTAATRVEVVGADGGVRLSDTEVDHFECGCVVYVFKLCWW